MLTAPLFASMLALAGIAACTAKDDAGASAAKAGSGSSGSSGTDSDAADGPSATEAGNPDDESRTGKAFVGLGVRQAGGLALQDRQAPPVTEPSDAAVPPGATVVLERFTLDNTILSGEVAVADDMMQVSWGQETEVYGISPLAVFTVDTKTGARTDLEIGACDGRVSSLSGVTWDSKRRRLVVSTLGGQGYLCAYDPAEKSWSLIGEFADAADYVGIVYDAAADNLVAIPAGRGGQQNVTIADRLVRLSLLDASRAVALDVALDTPLTIRQSWFHGSSQFGLVDDLLVVRTVFPASDNPELGAKMHSEIRTVNVKSGAVETRASTLQDVIATFTKPRAADGNIVVLSNYEGGSFELEIDIDVPGLKIGIATYGPVHLTLTGAYAGQVAGVLVVGFESGASVAGVDPGLITIKNGADTVAPYYDPSGASTIVCATGADDGGGCNTVNQVEAYFREAFAPGNVRGVKVQYEAFGSLRLSEFTP